MKDQEDIEGDHDDYIRNKVIDEICTYIDNFNASSSDDLMLSKDEDFIDKRRERRILYLCLSINIKNKFKV